MIRAAFKLLRNLKLYFSERNINLGKAILCSAKSLFCTTDFIFINWLYKAKLQVCLYNVPARTLPLLLPQIFSEVFETTCFQMFDYFSFHQKGIYLCMLFLDCRGSCSISFKKARLGLKVLPYFFRLVLIKDCLFFDKKRI